jgi:hypothetical protein
VSFGWAMNYRPCYLYSILSSTLHHGILNLSLLQFSLPQIMRVFFSVFPSPRFRLFQIRVSLCCHLSGLMLRAHDSEMRKIILNLRTSQTVDNPIDKFYDGSLCYG